MSVIVDVVSDVICPWCYIGKRRLERARRSFGPDHAVQIRWHPFQLNPRMPREGMDRRAYRTAKFGSWERSQALDERVRAVGEVEGIVFDFGRISRTPNTLAAHRLITLAGEQGVQDSVVEALFRGYFTEGKDLSDEVVLLDLVAEGGLDRELAKALLDGNEGLESVQTDEDQARRLGVEGVPFFVINGEVVVSGAQEPEAFLTAFKRRHQVLPKDDRGVCQINGVAAPSC